MRRCIVHFGMNKTGSSSIQATLYNCSLGPAFHYIDLGVDNPTGPLLDAFMLPKRRLNSIRNRSRKMTIERVRKRQNLVLSKLREQLDSATAPTLILSAEGLWRLTYQELSELHQFIQPYVDKIEAVAYVRPPKGFMESNFQQLVKGGLDKLDLSSGVYPNYRARFEKFDEIFGAENVQYWRFSPSLFKENCVVKDFCSRLNITESVEVHRVNEGLSRNATAALFSYRKFYSRFPERDRFNKENELLIRRLYDLPGKKLRFSSQLVKPLLDESQEDIRWIESRLHYPLLEDIDKHDDYAVSTEEDLLSIDNSALGWLLDQIEVEHFNDAQSTPETIAELIHQLRIKLSDEDTSPVLERRTVKGTNVNIKKLVRKAQKAYPKLQNQLSEQETIALVRGIFGQIVQELDDTDTGSVSVPGLGKFTVREIEKIAEGNNKLEKRIVFTP